MNSRPYEVEVAIPSGGVKLAGELHLPPDAPGLVLFAHGSGSNWRSPRNQFVANLLHQKNIGTLLFDLMTGEEAAAEQVTRHLRFNIQFLATRLTDATRWILDQSFARGLNPGYFGSSTGAAAALVAAAEFRATIGAVVSRGGRPDLAGNSLRRVTAPTLLIVGENDPGVIGLNEEAFLQMRCEKSLRKIPGASHLFEEPGTLEQVAEMAAAWFAAHFQKEIVSTRAA